MVRTELTAITISDSIDYLDEILKEYFPRKGPQDTDLFFNKLLEEIMEDSGNPEMFGNHSLSSRILVSFGLTDRQAMEVSLELYTSVVNSICSAFPTMTFGDINTRYTFSLIDRRDLCIVELINDN